MSELRVYDRISEVVGWTPLLRLHASVAGVESAIFAKLEFLNPMGSVKDRIARHLVEKALEEGRLRPGGTVVESSSGNTAMGLAMMAVLHGLHCRFVVRRQTSPEKLDVLRAMGAELVLVDGGLPPGDPDSYNRKTARVLEEDPQAYFPDQHNNRENNEAHYRTTGPEIWRQMDGRIDFLVAGMGTGGTLCGAARYLKEQDPSIQAVAVDPAGSVFHDFIRTGVPGTPKAGLLEGLGDEEIIGCPEFELVDDVVVVDDRQSFHGARDLLRTEGVLAGGSSGAALHAVRQVARRAGRPARIVTVFPDSGFRYLSTIFNDDWMRRHGFLDDAPGG